MNPHNFLFGCSYQEVELVCYKCHFTDRRLRKNLCGIVSRFHVLFPELWVGFASHSQRDISLKVLEQIQYCYQPFNSIAPAQEAQYRVSKVRIFKGKEPAPLQTYDSLLCINAYPKTFIKGAKFRGNGEQKGRKAWGKKQVAHIKRGQDMQGKGMEPGSLPSK